MLDNDVVNIRLFITVIFMYNSLENNTVVNKYINIYLVQL
jgi:hypothetical protein